MAGTRQAQRHATAKLNAMTFDPWISVTRAICVMTISYLTDAAVSAIPLQLVAATLMRV